VQRHGTAAAAAETTEAAEAAPLPSDAEEPQIEALTTEFQSPVQEQSSSPSPDELVARIRGEVSRRRNVSEP
jgi:hypothetical protein